MSKKRRMFDIDIPEDDAPAPALETKSRSPMAAAISENAEALKTRRDAETQIRGKRPERKTHP